MVGGDSFRFCGSRGEKKRKLPSEYEHLVGVGEHAGLVATSGVRRVSFGRDEFPLPGFRIEGVEVVEGFPFVVDSSVSSEEVDFLFVEDGGVVRDGGRSSDLAFLVFGRSTGFLVGWLVPGPVAGLQDIGVIESELGGVLASEDQHFVILDLAGGVVGSGVGNITLDKD